MQYQSKSMLDWAFHLKHLQFILLEFDANSALGEFIIIKYFQKYLKPSIRVTIKQYNHKLDSFEDTI